ncbi:MAG: hypothetical protein E6Q36_00085 [Chryseobacterium sp.]|nr:MAG: hypothetical protein E6Q36_00085 [Chryseobacterium sp.]
MKRYLFGLIAVISAVVLMSFNGKEKKAPVSDYYFEFTGASPTIANVEDEGQWTLTTGAHDCDIINRKACVVGVPTSLTYMDGTTRKLSPDAALVATEYILNVAYVSGGATGVDPTNTQP